MVVAVDRRERVAKDVKVNEYYVCVYEQMLGGYYEKERNPFG